MNDLQPPVPPQQAKPFEPERTPAGGGFQKPILIGCGLLALLLGIGAVVFVVKAKDVLAYAMNKLKAEVVAHLPEDASEVERQQLEAGFDTALARIRGGTIDPASLQELQKELTAAAAAGGARRMTREELTGLIAALDKFNRAGEETRSPPPASPAPASPGDSAEPADPGDKPAEESRPPAP